MFQANCPVVITTQYRGVFFGYVVDISRLPAQITLNRCRNIIYWPVATKGYHGLAVSGPPLGSKVGPATPLALRFDITGVDECTPEAAEQWEKAPWQ